MTYLSRRCREIKDEEARRKRRGTVTDLNIFLPAGAPRTNYNLHDSVFTEIGRSLPKAMMMAVPGFEQLYAAAFERYEQTLRARNPHFRNRGA